MDGMQTSMEGNFIPQSAKEEVCEENTDRETENMGHVSEQN